MGLYSFEFKFEFECDRLQPRGALDAGLGSRGVRGCYRCLPLCERLQLAVPSALAWVSVERGAAATASHRAGACSPPRRPRRPPT